jgi:uncharacterized RDD family membrane protein YckC
MSDTSGERGDWSTDYQSGSPDGAGGTAPSTPGSVPYDAAGGPDPTALAGFWIRLGGALLDAILLGFVTGFFRSQLLTFIVSGAYFTYLHATPAGQTVGNRVCGIRVVDAANGGKLDYGRTLLRFLMSYVSGIALLIGYLWMLWDPRKQTWHDKIANSVVVKADRYPPPTPFGRAS